MRRIAGMSAAEAGSRRIFRKAAPLFRRQQGAGRYGRWAGGEKPNRCPGAVRRPALRKRFEGNFWRDVKRAKQSPAPGARAIPGVFRQNRRKAGHAGRLRKGMFVPIKKRRGSGCLRQSELCSALG